ncbi:MAG: CocE/NonD family hydrolase, partial [Solirubrobacteraceae bacterium]
MSEAVVVERDLHVAARDGIQLATDVYRPQGDGPFPTLVFRVRGSRSAAFITGVLIVNPLEAVRRGYAVVIQEVRGRSGSQAHWHPFVHEREDGEDCLEWVLAQPWCDGRLGSYGTAYSAVTALAMASLARDELKALVLLGTGADYHDGWVYTNGAFELGWNIYWAYMTLSETIMRMDISAEEKLALRREYSEAIKTA